MSTTSQFQFPDDPGMHNTPNMPRGPGDTFTTSSYRQNSSWLQRVQSSCAGILIGIAIIVGACCLQFWNEVGLNYTSDIFLPVSLSFAFVVKLSSGCCCILTWELSAL